MSMMIAGCARPNRSWWRRASSRRTVVFAAVLFAACPAVADEKPDIKKLKVEPLEITATPIASFSRSGASAIDGSKLTWRGGLVLTSAHKNFGGWSGLIVDPDGRRFVTISDSGSWMSGEITYAGATLSGIKGARIGPLLTLEGVTLKRGRDRDAEAVTLESGSLDSGTILIAFEQNARIARYDFSYSGGVSQTRNFLPLPNEAKKMRRNSGFEAMTVLRGGAFNGSTLAFAERMRDLKRNHVGWIWSPTGARQIQLADQGDFDIAEATALDDGGILVLERRFRWVEGLHIRIRRVAAAELESGAVLQGEVLLEADLTSEIDNMEGMAVSRLADGSTLLTLISDDNFNHYLQRTLLLQFAMPADLPGSGAAPQTAKARQ